MDASNGHEEKSSLLTIDGIGGRHRARNSSGRVTISDIAKSAGVSKTAVSFAFNMPGRLSKETTQHILEVAKRMGYTPNPIARSLNTRRTNSLGVLIPQDIPIVMSNPFFAELLNGIGEVCKQEGFSLMIVPPMRGSLLDATYGALVDGCIVNGLSADDPVVRALIQRRIPFVMIDTDAPAHIASVNVKDFDGAKLAMQHVLQHGHRNIAIVSFNSLTRKVKDYTGTMRKRIDGYSAALGEHNLTLDSPGIHVMESECSEAGGRDAFDRMMKLEPRPTAVLALSDIIAWGVIEAARENKMHVPNDLAVVGFDDLLASRLISPALTTVRQPTIEKGKRAAQLFIQILRCETPTTEAEKVLLPVELIVRASSVTPVKP